MKKILTILLLFAIKANAGTIYISTSGNDGSGNGSSGSPYATLSKAASVAVSGDMIHIGVGNYTLPSAITLPVGVSIVGEGQANTILICTYTLTDQNTGAITMVSPDGTNGNQSISNLTMDGNNLTARGAIVNRGRSNVIIHDVTLQNFGAFGVIFNGSATNSKPTINATGNQLYNCTITNCADRLYAPVGIGANIVATGYSGMLIHDNVITQTARPLNHNGNIFSATNTGWSDGLKYYNNKSYKNINDANSGFSFHMEMWDSQGGMEIYNNEFHGGIQHIDFGGTTSKSKGTYDYSIYIHDNLFTMDTAVNSAMTLIPLGVNFEGNVQNAIVEHNHFKNMPYGVFFSLNQSDVGAPTQDSIMVKNNLFENGGYTNGNFAFDIIVTDGVGATLKNLSIFNNTIITRSRGGFYMILGSSDTAKNIKIINNIIQGTVNYGYIVFNGNTGIKDSFYVQNNIAYNNAFSNNINYLNGALPPTHLTNTGVIKLNPKLNTDYTLQAGSPAIDAGIDVGLPYHGSAPDIGAFETGYPAPSVSTSGDQSISVTSTNIFSVPVPGSGASITGYSWTKVSGPTCTISNPTSQNTGLTGLVTGSYKFRITITQSDGQTAYAEINVGVTLPNLPPVVNAGPDQFIVLPQTTLSGTVTPASGTTATYLWTKVSGNGVIDDGTNLTTQVSGLNGLSVFRLTATQSDGQIVSDDVDVTANLPSNKWHLKGKIIFKNKP